MNATPRSPSGGPARRPPPPSHSPLPPHRYRRRSRRGWLAVAAGLTALVVAGVAGAVGAVDLLSAPDAGSPRRTAALAPPASTRPAAPRPPGCTRTGGHGRDFPVLARIHGGPDTYRAGDTFRYWAVDLVNRTPGGCRHLYPVVVLTDGRRVLQPEQVRLGFHDGTRWRPVPMAHTSHDENVGAFGATDPDLTTEPTETASPSGTASPTGTASPSGTASPPATAGPALPPFPGFTLPPGATRTVRVRLALTADTVPTDVRAVVALVQRHGGDGDWVGESRAYRFTVAAGS